MTLSCLVPSTDVSVPELIKTAERIGNDWYRLGLKLNIPSYRLDTLVQPAQGGPERHPIRVCIVYPGLFVIYFVL